MIAISSVPILREFIVGHHINTYGDKVTFSMLDNRVLSVQPDGSIQYRPEGTAGPFELAVLIGDKLIYNPISGLNVFVFAFINRLP